MCCDATYGGLPIKPGIGASGEENCYWIYEYYWGAEVMRQVPLERDINIAVNGCSGFETSTRKEPFMAMLTSCSRGTYLIE